MVDIQTISIAIASAGVLIAAAYYALQIRHQTRIRKTDLIIRLYSRMHSSEFEDAYPKIMSMQFEDYEDFLRKYGPRHSGKSPEIAKAIGAVCGFFELVGILLYRGYIDLQLVYDVFGSGMVREIWEKVRPVTMGMRRREGNELVGVGCEYLYNELVRKEPQLKKTYPLLRLPPGSNSSDKSSR